MSGSFGVVVLGPLAGFADGFAGRLEAVGYAPRSIAAQLRLVGQLSGWLDVCGLTVGDLGRDTVGQFIAVRRVTSSNFRSPKALAPLLGYLRSLGVTPAAVEAAGSAEEVLLERFGIYLREERGLAADTVRSYVSQVRPFVAAHSGEEGGWAALSEAQVGAFVRERAAWSRPRSLQVRVNALRALLRWMGREQLVSAAMAGAVGRVSAPMIAVPKALTADELEGMLSSLSVDGAARARDEVMVRLMWRLGFRAGEVAGLRLGDIDWAAGVITVRGKRGRVDQVPLPVDVGEGLVGYLGDARPAGTAHREVFLAIDAPHGPVGRAAVSSVVSRALRLAGIPDGAAHRLRHTAARSVLASGGGLVETGQLLRHGSVSVTAVYATCDVGALAVLARPWPEATR